MVKIRIAEQRRQQLFFCSADFQRCTGRVKFAFFISVQLLFNITETLTLLGSPVFLLLYRNLRRNRLFAYAGFISHAGSIQFPFNGIGNERQHLHRSVCVRELAIGSRQIQPLFGLLQTEFGVI